MFTQKLSIRKRIFLGMLIIFMVPVILFAVFSLRINYNAMRKQLVKDQTLSMDWLGSSLRLSTNKYIDQFYEYEVNKGLKANINSWAKTGNIDYMGQHQIKQSFETSLNINPDIKTVEIYSLLTGKGFVSSRASFYSTNNQQALDIWKARNKDLQTNIVFDTSGEDILVLHQTNDFTTGKGLALIVLRLKPTAFDSILDKLKQDATEGIFLINDENKMLFSSAGISKDLQPDIELLGQLAEKGNNPLESLRHFYFYRSIHNGKLQVLYVVSNATLMKVVWQTTKMGLLVLALATVAAFYLSLLFSRLISQPIVQLSSTMQKANIQDYTSSGETNRQDEIGLLHQSFEQMMEQNQQLITNEYQIKLEKRGAQVRALQAQINPHFLYNTLQLIGGMSIENQSEEIYPIVNDLSDIMRYSFDFSNEMVPLEKEIQFLESYIHIQNHRFDNRLSLTKEISPELMNALVPKLILQPILENSFTHGLVEKPGQWRITLRAFKKDEGDILITIKDNGLGISPKRLEQLENQLKNNEEGALRAASQIGLQNVHARLQLRYGPQYGVSIASVPDKHTTISILTKHVTVEYDSDLK